jgi:hypothetical protein
MAYLQGLKVSRVERQMVFSLFTFSMEIGNRTRYMEMKQKATMSDVHLFNLFYEGNVFFPDSSANIKPFSCGFYVSNKET